MHCHTQWKDFILIRNATWLWPYRGRPQITEWFHLFHDLSNRDLSNTNIMVRTGDSHIVVILTEHYERFWQRVHQTLDSIISIRITVCVPRNCRYLDTNELHLIAQKRNNFLILLYLYPKFWECVEDLISLLSYFSIFIFLILHEIVTFSHFPCKHCLLFNKLHPQ